MTELERLEKAVVDADAALVAWFQARDVLNEYLKEQDND